MLALCVETKEWSVDREDEDRVHGIVRAWVMRRDATEVEVMK
jgi:hypothetical protein